VAGENCVKRRFITYSLPDNLLLGDKVKEDVAREGQMRTAYGNLVEKAKRKGPLGRARHRWKD
jgi:hypothetical protein